MTCQTMIRLWRQWVERRRVTRLRRQRILEAARRRRAIDRYLDGPEPQERHAFSLMVSL